MPVPARIRGRLIERAVESQSDRPRLSLGPLLHAELAAASTLLAGTAIALVVANSPLRHATEAFLHARVGIHIAGLSIDLDLIDWVNEGLMTFFFFLVGLEVKRALVHGELATRRKAALPLAATLGGMVVPLGTYLLFNAGGPGEGGWGIPVATDIAFALGILALAGNRVPPSLKIFLLAMATGDDVGGVIVIALFYAHRLSLVAIGAMALIAIAIYAFQRRGVHHVGVYAVLGVLLWVATLESGIHATIAGVILGLLTPARPRTEHDAYLARARALLEEYRDASERDDAEQADVVLGQLEERTRATDEPLERIERLLRPWVSYVVLPVFALVNAGIALDGPTLAHALTSRVTYGVIAGLVLGKTVGIPLASWIAVRLGLAELPRGLRFRHVVGVAMIASVGFTVSLFIAQIAFTEPTLEADARIGVLVASLIGGIAGVLWLRLSAPAAAR